MHSAHASMPSEEPATYPAQTIQGAGHAAGEAGRPASPASRIEGTPRKLVRYRRRNAVTENAVEAMACMIAAMGHTEIEPASLGKRRAGATTWGPRLIRGRMGQGAGYHSDEAITVHGDGEEPGSPPSVPQDFFTSTVQPA
ncbi:hypothetical protein T484DRAFT_1749922 [Baffinella frigidus]|nr:hypothetical protein T484DRAFT_1749922 [Cryptophyta sp. CCMP2293]